MLKDPSPDEIADDLLEDDLLLDTSTFMAVLSMNDSDCVSASNYFQKLLGAYQNEVRLRRQLQAEATESPERRGARAMFDEFKRHERLEVRPRRLTAADFERGKDKAWNTATRAFWHMGASAAAFLVGIAVVVQYFWHPDAFYREAGQAALWLGGGALIGAPLAFIDFRTKERAARTEWSSWSKRLEKDIEGQ